MIELPIFQNSSSDFTFNIDLDLISCTVRLIYNIRNGSWFMDLVTASSSIQGVRLVEDFPLLYQNKAIISDLKGDFLVTRITDVDSTELTYDNFGVDWVLQYLTSTEVDAWSTTNGI